MQFGTSGSQYTFGTYLISGRNSKPVYRKNMGANFYFRNYFYAGLIKFGLLSEALEILVQIQFLNLFLFWYVLNRSITDFTQTK